MDNAHSLRLAKALSHPVRIQILMSMNTPRRRMSPKNFADESGCTIGNSSYHFRKLHKLGFLHLASTRQRRGSTEHFYEPVKRAVAWSKEWERMSPVLKANLEVVAALGWVKAIGQAFDAGTFDARKDSHLSWDTMRVDDTAWTQLTALMNRTLKEAIAIGEECAERLGDEGGFFASLGMSLFEAPPPPEPSA
jgi:hypothetical protein